MPAIVPSVVGMAESLEWKPVAEIDLAGLLPNVVRDAVNRVPSARVAAIDPNLADTAAFCEAYGVSLEQSANCVVVAGKRAGAVNYAAVLVQATRRADINGIVRRHLGAKKLSFASQDDAVAHTGMEFGGITPVGLPGDWPILIDAGVVDAGEVVIGSGIRGSKLLVRADELLGLPNATALDLALP